MRDSLELFQKSLEDYSSDKNVQNHLIELIESLNKDLENERNSVVILQKQINSLMKQKTFGITSKFVALKAELATLQQSVSALKNENDELNIQLIAKGEETKKLLLEKEQELQSHYLTQIKQKEQEIEVSRLNLKKKEQELHNEMQAAEVSSALEFDQMESNFKKQLSESEKKLQDSMATCKFLRAELMTVKEQFSQYKHSSNEKVAELQRRLREMHNTEDRTFTEFQQDQILNSSVNLSVNIDEKVGKYQPLDVSSVSLEKPMNLKKTPVFRGSGRSFYNKNTKNHTIPPLIDLKDTNAENKESKPVSKRRKLFNPEDLSYLNKLENNE